MANLTQRPHGYARYKLDNCRCYVCGYAVSLYEENRRKQIAAGTWQPFIDHAVVRDHIEAHRRAGIGSRRLAELAGVDRKVIHSARTGLRKGRPMGRMRRDVADKILAVPVSAERAAPHASIDAIGAHRRIRALCAVGWGFGTQAQLAGWSRSNWHNLTRRDRIMPGTLALVRGVYDKLAMTPAPDCYATTRARAVAAREGWFPPLAWEDDTIDDPAALPCIVPPVGGTDRAAGELALQHAAAGHAVQLDPVTRVELVRRLTAAGYPTEVVASLAGTTVGNVGRIRSDHRIGARRVAA